MVECGSGDYEIHTCGSESDPAEVRGEEAGSGSMEAPGRAAAGYRIQVEGHRSGGRRKEINQKVILTVGLLEQVGLEDTRGRLVPSPAMDELAVNAALIARRRGVEVPGGAGG